MKQVPFYGDERQVAMCAYCAGPTGTMDHVPSQVLLDDPYPENLPKVPACWDCNNGLSKDEEYVACLIECAIAGSVDPADVGRAKVRRTLETRPTLVGRLAAALKRTDEKIEFEIEQARVRNVLLQLARGHALYELNEPQHEEPAVFDFSPFPTMPDDMRSRFERLPVARIWPEVGSRAMQRLGTSVGAPEEWIVVQAGRYRYATHVGGGGVLVRIVLSEYLACEALWS